MIDIAKHFIAQSRGFLSSDYLPKIERCLEVLSDENVWWRANEASNSIGNLLLHLEGSTLAWIIGVAGGVHNERDRQQEFDERGPFPTTILVRHLDELVEEMEKVLNNLTAERMLQPVDVQGFNENGVSVLVHIVEHFSYHTGQITYYVKWRKNINTAYYGDMNLDAVGRVGFD